MPNEHLSYTIKLELTVDTLQSLRDVYDFLSKKLSVMAAEEKHLFYVIIRSMKVSDVILEAETVEPEPEAVKTNGDITLNYNPYQDLRCISEEKGFER